MSLEYADAHLPVVTTVKTLLVYGDRALITTRGTNDTHRPGQKDLPGGQHETGETYPETAVREIAEEIAMQIDPLTLEEVAHIDHVRPFKDSGETKRVIYRLYWGRLATRPPNQAGELVLLERAAEELDHERWSPLVQYAVDLIILPALGKSPDVAS